MFVKSRRCPFPGGLSRTPTPRSAVLLKSYVVGVQIIQFSPWKICNYRSIVLAILFVHNCFRSHLMNTNKSFSVVIHGNIRNRLNTAVINCEAWSPSWKRFSFNYENILLSSPTTKYLWHKGSIKFYLKIWFLQKIYFKNVLPKYFLRTFFHLNQSNSKKKLF